MLQSSNLFSFATPFLTVLLAMTTGSFIGCSDGDNDCIGEKCDETDSDKADSDETDSDEIDSFVELDHGAKWEQFRSLYRYTAQGSRMVPYRWLINLEQADSEKPFVDPPNMKQLGFNIEPNPSEQSRSLNPDGLPIGFVKDPEPGMFGEQWAGLTCSACHTGTITYQKTSFLIDGASGLLDLHQTEADLLDAVKETIFNANKQDRFNDKVLGASTPEEREQLELQLIDYWLMLNGRIERGAPAVPGALLGQSGTIDLPPGPGRVDAFTLLINETICEMLPEPDNCRPANTPTTYGQLWGVGDMDWAQTNSLTHAVLGRNVGEVLGVYAHSSLDNCSPEHPQLCDFNSTADIDNLVAIEDWLKDLDSPKWPSQFPAIDATLANQGLELYKRDCERCHSLPDSVGKYPTNDPNPASPNECRTFIQTTSTPICFDYNGIDLLGGLAAANCDAPDVIGTDPFMAANLLARTGKTGILAPIFDGREEVSAAELLGTMQTILIQQQFAQNGYSPAEIQRALDFRGSASPPVSQLAGYKARPLAGIAFAAPYLHNNSVPTIYELLLQPAERVTEFWVGRNEYDPEKLGYDSSAPRSGEALFHFNTKIPGNLNGGHAFGTASADYTGNRKEDRLAVLEYLKTLDVTPRTEPSSCE